MLVNRLFISDTLPNFMLTRPYAHETLTLEQGHRKPEKFRAISLLLLCDNMSQGTYKLQSYQNVCLVLVHKSE